MMETSTSSGSRRNMSTKRIKLGGQLSAHLESGTKLTLNHSCPPHCRGMDQNVVLFEPGLKKLQDQWEQMGQCLAHNQHYTILLELNFDPELNMLDYVTVSVAPDQNLLFHHYRADLLSTDYYNPKYLGQSITLNQKAYNKLGDFIAKHSQVPKALDESSINNNIDGVFDSLNNYANEITSSAAAKNDEKEEEDVINSNVNIE
jgi:hypothetical protein